MHSYLDDVLGRIQDLLVLNTPDNGYQHLLSSEDQNFLYETTGSLIVSSNLPPEVSITEDSNLCNVNTVASTLACMFTHLPIALHCHNIIIFLGLKVAHVENNGLGRWLNANPNGQSVVWIFIILHKKI